MDTRKTVIASRRGRTGCATALFVDGVFVGTTMDTDIDRYVNPVHIEGVEVYDGPAGLPAQFNKGNAPCGALVIWTRT